MAIKGILQRNFDIFFEIKLTNRFGKVGYIDWVVTFQVTTQNNHQFHISAKRLIGVELQNLD